MNYLLSETQKSLKDSARAFAEKVIEGEAMEYDVKGLFPKETFQRMGREGFLGISVPVGYGGCGGAAVEYTILCEEIAKVSAAYIHNGHYQTQRMLMHYGTEEQRKEILPKLTSGEWLAATAISEPGVGSSFAGMSSMMKRAGNYYILNGEKIHINDAAEAKIINFFATGNKGLTAFLIDTDKPGFEILKKMDPIGLRASPIYSFHLMDYRVPEERRIGQEGQGIQVFFSAFNFSRIGNASCLLGIGSAALEKAIVFAKERKVGSNVVTDFQGIRWMVAELYTRLESAFLLRDKAAWMEDQGRNPARETSMAKLLAGEVSLEIVSQCIQITGSYGCYRNAPFERYFRDAKSLCIAGGTLEVMKNNIAKQILG